MIRCHDVVSSMMERIAYDDAAQRLVIQFNQSAVYEYFNVDASLVEDMLNASSKGTYFHENIRGVFQYNRIGDFPDATPEVAAVNLPLQPEPAGEFNFADAIKEFARRRKGMFATVPNS